MAREKIKVVQAAQKTDRRLRRPQHTFSIKHKPYQLQPFLLAPVLPGETLDNMLLQARGTSEPVANELIGWWTEYYFYYVKHRHMPNFEHFKDMVMTPGYDISPAHGAAPQPNHYFTDGINWVQECMEPVVREFFRDEDEPWDAAMRDNLPLAKVNAQNWTDSLKLGSTTPDTDDIKLPGEDFMTEDHHVLPGFEAARQQFEHMRALNLTDATYEDWLKQYGVKPPEKERIERPEEIRYLRSWNYPQATVRASGSQGELQTQSLTWAISERADKNRAFNEPGFIIGLACVRPKIYMTKQMQHASTFLNDAYSWLPALLNHDPYTSLKQFAVDAGPIDDTSEGYWLDARDLFLYGDQFHNYDPATDKFNGLSLPDANARNDYATDAEVDAMFADPLLTSCYQDGITSLAIKSMQRDHT